MKPGDVIQTSHVRVYFFPEKGYAGYKADRKEAFVLIFLGTEPRDGSKPLDPVKRLNELGWELTRELNDND